MKVLNKEAAGVFHKLLSMINDEGYVKVDNSEGLFMPVSVEVLQTTDTFTDVSIAHYFEQNGDLMADPEMCFIYDGENVYPYYFKQDSLGIEEVFGYVDKDNKFFVSDEPKQADQTEFADMWMVNIKMQQGI